MHYLYRILFNGQECDYHLMPDGLLVRYNNEQKVIGKYRDGTNNHFFCLELFVYFMNAEVLEFIKVSD